jgi:hypothetical protein
MIFESASSYLTSRFWEEKSRSFSFTLSADLLALVVDKALQTWKKKKKKKKKRKSQGIRLEEGEVEMQKRKEKEEEGAVKG